MLQVYQQMQGGAGGATPDVTTFTSLIKILDTTHHPQQVPPGLAKPSHVLRHFVLHLPFLALPCLVWSIPTARGWPRLHG